MLIGAFKNSHGKTYHSFQEAKYLKIHKKGNIFTVDFTDITFLWIMGIKYYKILRRYLSPAIIFLNSGAARVGYFILFPFLYSVSPAGSYNHEIVKLSSRPAQNSLILVFTNAPSSLDHLFSPFFCLQTFVSSLALIIPSPFKSDSCLQPLLSCIHCLHWCQLYFWKGSGCLCHNSTKCSHEHLIAPALSLPWSPVCMFSCALLQVGRQCGGSQRIHWTIAFLRKCHLLARNSQPPRLIL